MIKIFLPSFQEIIKIFLPSFQEIIISFISWLMVFIVGSHHMLSSIHGKILIFLIISSLRTGSS